MSAGTGRTLRLERLVNRRVVDADGRYVGRVEEVRAAIVLGPAGNEYRVTEYVLSRGGPFARAVRMLLEGERRRRWVVPWAAMDLSDPARPRLTCPREALRVDSGE